jgi:hypothetical protein
MALTASRNTRRDGGEVTPEKTERIVRNAVQVYQGGMVVADAAGTIVPAGNANGVTQVIGRAESDVLGDGTRTVRVTSGCMWYTNTGSSIFADDLYKSCYATDDEAVQLSDAGTLPKAGIIVDIDATLGVCVLMSPYLFAGGGESIVQRRAVTYGHADLTATALTQSIVLGTAIPATAMILGYRIQLNEVFAGGAISAMDLQIGDDTNDDDSICAASDMFTGSTLLALAWVQGTRGVQPNGPPTGTQLEVLFTAVGANVDQATTGEVDVEVFYLDLATFL